VAFVFFKCYNFSASNFYFGFSGNTKPFFSGSVGRELLVILELYVSHYILYKNNGEIVSG